MPLAQRPSAIREDPGRGLRQGFQGWLRFHRELSRDAGFLLTEAVIVGWLEKLEWMEADDPRVYWLTLARLAEAALLQAGAYADACEFQAAGDLLVNPRRIEIRVRGGSKGVVKDRHRGLGEQFAAMMGDEAPAVWLRHNVRPRIRQEALLPHLKGMLTSSGCIASEYLGALAQRMEKVAHTIAFLGAWQVNDGADLHRRITASAPGERRFILSNLCRFEKDRFLAMGQAVEQIIRSNGASRIRPAHGGSIFLASYAPPRQSFRR